MNNKEDQGNASDEERSTFLAINVTTNSMGKLPGNQSFKPFNQAKNGVMQG